MRARAGLVTVVAVLVMAGAAVGAHWHPDRVQVCPTLGISPGLGPCEELTQHWTLHLLLGLSIAAAVVVLGAVLTYLAAARREFPQHS
jgi:hypothetical protein